MTGGEHWPPSAVARRSTVVVRSRGRTVLPRAKNELLDHRDRRRIRHHGTLPVEVPSDVLEIEALRDDGRSSRADHWPVVNAD
jgi:hypothetical protein